MLLINVSFTPELTVCRSLVCPTRDTVIYSERSRTEKEHVENINISYCPLHVQCSGILKCGTVGVNLNFRYKKPLDGLSGRTSDLGCPSTGPLLLSYHEKFIERFSALSEIHNPHQWPQVFSFNIQEQREE